MTGLTLEKNITVALKQHLTTTNRLPANTEVTKLAEILTQVVFDQLQEADVDLTAGTKVDATEKRLAARSTA